MSHYMSSMIAMYVAVAAVIIYIALKRLIRHRRAERKHMQRIAAREAELRIVGQRVQREMELERILKLPACFKEKKQQIRKAVGLFSDEEAQEKVR